MMLMTIVMVMKEDSDDAVDHINSINDGDVDVDDER